MPRIPRTRIAVVVLFSPKYAFLDSLFKYDTDFLPFAKSKILVNSYRSNGVDCHAADVIELLVQKL